MVHSSRPQSEQELSLSIYRIRLKISPRHLAASQDRGEIMTASADQTAFVRLRSVINIQIDEGRERGGERAVHSAAAAFKSPKHDGAR